MSSFSNDNMLVQYVRNHGKTYKNIPTSVVVGVRIDGKVYIGWACCNRHEHFIKAKGRAIALARCLAAANLMDKNQIVRNENINVSGSMTVPYEVSKMINNRFMPRCQGRFGCSPSEITIVS
jgi:hypothetical protein